MVKVLGLILAALAVEMILGAGSELVREMIESGGVAAEP
jgi:small neutral amino acid transporter SnatA (MarC family)